MTDEAEGQVMRLYEALDALGKQMQATLGAAENCILAGDPVNPEAAAIVCRMARHTGEVQGMASILETLGYAADR